MAFADSIDVAYTLKHDREHVFRKPVPLSMVPDSQFLFDVLIETTCLTEKRLMIDLETVKDAYNSLEISDLALFRSGINIVGPLTKPKANSI